MTDIIQLQGYLAEAQNALHALNTGTQVVEFDRNGTKIKYTPATVPALERYISKLQSDIAAAGGGGTRRRAMVNIF